MRAVIAEIRVRQDESIDQALRRLDRILKRSLTSEERRRIKDKNRGQVGRAPKGLKKR